MKKKRTEILGTLRKVLSKNGKFYFLGNLDGGLTVILKKSTRLDENGCEVWNLILKDQLLKSR